MVGASGPDLNEVMVQHEPAARMLSPGLSEARVQHPTSVGSVSANPNEVRVRGAKLPELFSFFWYSLERKLVSVVQTSSLTPAPGAIWAVARCPLLRKAAIRG